MGNSFITTVYCWCHFYPLFYEALCKQYTHLCGRDDVRHLKMLGIHECASFSSRLYMYSTEEELYAYSRPLFQCSFKRYQKDKTATFSAMPQNSHQDETVQIYWNCHSCTLVIRGTPFSLWISNQSRLWCSILNEFSPTVHLFQFRAWREKRKIMHEIISSSLFLRSYFPMFNKPLAFFSNSVCVSSVQQLVCSCTSLLWPLISSCEIPQQ